MNNNNRVSDMYDVKIVIGGRSYEPYEINWIQDTDFDFPRIEVGAVVNPSARIIAKPSKGLTIKNVIFNPPATIVFWSDGTKTVVKCDERFEDYDPEKGIAMAIAKKLLGNNKYEYYNVFLHWLKKWDKQHTAKEEVMIDWEKYFDDLDTENDEE